MGVDVTQSGSASLISPRARSRTYISECPARRPCRNDVRQGRETRISLGWPVAPLDATAPGRRPDSACRASRLACLPSEFHRPAVGGCRHTRRAALVGVVATWTGPDRHPPEMLARGGRVPRWAAAAGWARRTDVCIASTPASSAARPAVIRTRRARPNALAAQVGGGGGGGLLGRWPGSSSRRSCARAQSAHTLTGG